MTTNPTPATEPLQSEISAKLDGKTYFDCGTAADLSFGGYAPYTMEAWIQPAAVNGGFIVGKMNGGVAAECSLLLTSGGNVISYRNVDPWNVQSKTVLQVGQWYHVATTYDGHTLSLYIDGALEASGAFSSQPGVPNLPTTIGAQLQQGQLVNYFQGLIREVRIWNVCRTADEIMDSMADVGAASEGLVADYAFWIIPPGDVSFNSHAITANGTQTNVMESGALQLQNNAYADCGTTPDLSLGGNAPYTLEGWIYPTSVSGVQTIISKYDGDVLAEYGLWLYHGRLASYRNVVPWDVEAPTELVPDQWYHVATTYDGKTLSVYINGALQASTVFSAPQPFTPSVPTLIGARKSRGQLVDFFQGAIQNMRMWRLSMTQEQINEVMFQEPLPDDVALIANFDFSVPPASDVTEDHTVSLANGAVVTTKQQAVSGTVPPQGARRLSPPNAAFAPVPEVEPLSEPHIRALVDDFRTTLGPDVDPEESDQRAAQYEERIRELIAQTDTTPQGTGPHVHAVLDGNQYRVRLHVDGVLVDELGLDATEWTPYQVWLMTFTFTLITGFLDVFLNIRFGKGILGLLWKRIQGNGPVLAAVTKCIAAGATYTTLLGVIDAAYKTGLLKMILQWALSFWQILSFLLTLVQYLVPGLKQAVLAVRVAALVVRLALMIKSMPPRPAELPSFDGTPALAMA